MFRPRSQPAGSTTQRRVSRGVERNRQVVGRRVWNAMQRNSEHDATTSWFGAAICPPGPDEPALIDLAASHWAPLSFGFHLPPCCALTAHTLVALVLLEGSSSLARPRTAGSGDKQQQGDRFAWALGMMSLAQPRRAPPPRSTTTTIRHLASRVASHHITFTFLADDERVSALLWLARLAWPGLATPSSIVCVPRSRAPVDPIYLVCSALLDAYLPSQVINKKTHHRHGIPQHRVHARFCQGFGDLPSRGKGAGTLRRKS
ncbi:hypothetical protein CPLU01_02089 [Colletotrichum plurivorum]|uniref:Uncharacterized protein n=1 Tax=Colletotrichum plurivorum TaxID=2175906 RepID=A0A8H6NND8_9PEZI|nr:hypothetical protein CPLU01_02089 [Colletotrichum plurivorum]